MTSPNISPKRLQIVFRNYMDKNFGIVTKEEILADNILRYINLVGDAPDSKRGWYRLHPSGVGYFGKDKTLNEKWFFDREKQDLVVLRREHTRRIERSKRITA